VISAEIFIAFVEAPRDRETGDDAAEKILGLVGAQSRSGGAVEIVGTQRFIELDQGILPILPMENVMLAKLVVVLEQSGANLLSGFSDDGAETDGENEFSVASGEVDFAGAGDVAIFGAWVFPLHLEVSREVLPSIGGADESDRHFFPGNGTGEGEGGAIMLGEEHVHALVIADPGCIFRTAVGEVRREQGIEVVVRELALQRFEANLLQQDVAVRVSENFFMNAVVAVDFRIDEFEGGDARLEGFVFECAMAFLFGEVISSVCDHESEVASAGLIDAGKIHFVDNSVTYREPHFAMLI
jgi:hypothetical protein